MCDLFFKKQKHVYHSIVWLCCCLKINAPTLQHGFISLSSPENHITYGNRALCYIRCEKYL